MTLGVPDALRAQSAIRHPRCLLSNICAFGNYVPANGGTHGAQAASGKHKEEGLKRAAVLAHCHISITGPSVCQCASPGDTHSILEWKFGSVKICAPRFQARLRKTRVLAIGAYCVGEMLTRGGYLPLSSTCIAFQAARGYPA